jgi:hypothetical protein
MPGHDADAPIAVNRNDGISSEHIGRFDEGLRANARPSVNCDDLRAAAARAGDAVQRADKRRS